MLVSGRLAAQCRCVPIISDVRWLHDDDRLADLGACSYHTAFYAWATFEILRANKGVVQAMEAQTEAQLRPYVVAHVKVQLGTTLLFLYVENTGKSPALDLRLGMDKDFFDGEKQRDNLAKLPVFTQPIESLSPGARIPFVLGVSHTIFAPDIEETVCPKVFTGAADYSFGGKT